MYGHQTDYLDSTESGKYSARRIWEEYGDDDVEHSQFAGDLQEVEEDNRSVHISLVCYVTTSTN